MAAGPIKTSAFRVNVALRRAKVLQMRAAGATYDQILAQFPNDYKSRGAVVQDVQRALMLTLGEPAADLRALEAARLDMLWVRAMQVLSKTHIVVSQGRVMYITGPDGTEQPMQDDAPVLQAIRELRALSESRRKLLGLDAPAQVQVMSDDSVDAEIRRLTGELDRAEAAQTAGAAATAGKEG